MSCNKDEFTSKDGSCCDYCSAGEHLVTECSSTEARRCARCEHETYMATKNHLPSCHICKPCSLNNNQREMKACTATKDTVCECLPGFYCSNEDCDHCQPVTRCRPGEGVKVQATRTNNTVCAPCEDGTFSNVTDFLSPCKAHTRCKDYGRVLVTRGTQKTDATCGNFQTNCSWMLPAGLWSGLVLTIVIVLILLLWRAKRKSYRAVCCSPMPIAEAFPPPPLTLHQLSHCQETCKLDDCKLSIYNPDDTPIGCATEDSSDISLPKTLKTSVSFSESNHVNGSAGYCSGHLLRSHSEPQEDEWCGT